MGTPQPVDCRKRRGFGFLGAFLLGIGWIVAAVAILVGSLVQRFMAWVRRTPPSGE